MLTHFAANLDAPIRYVLFAHFPGVTDDPPQVGTDILSAALASCDKDLQSYITGLPADLDLDAFAKKFTMQFGPGYGSLVADVGHALEANGIPASDVDTLAYPNAVNIVATLSATHDLAGRTVTKRQFLAQLRDIRVTAISRWTLALKNRDKVLEARRKQIKLHLDKNARLRYLLIHPSSIPDYEKEVVLFIGDFLNKYHFKPAHIATPVLCLCATRPEIQDIQYRLYAKGIIATDGFVGSRFEEARFFREPLSKKTQGGTIEREFRLRILAWGDHGPLLNHRKCDDLFVIGDVDCEALDTTDVNVERVTGASMKEVEYLLGVSNVHD
jgi:hypothetical protein